ncbi:hypothetical protein Tco_1198397 [Tanacetum coccineum]
MNELVNDRIKLSKLEINIGFINRLPKKWLSFYQSLRNTNHMKEFELDSLFGKLKYEENFIDSIYETKMKKSLSTATPISTVFISNSIVQDFQDSPDDEEDMRSSQEYLNDLEDEFQERARIDKSIRGPKGLVEQKQLMKLNATNVGENKLELRPTKDFEAKYNKVKAKLALLSFGTSTSKSSMVKNKGLVAEAYAWDEEEVSLDDNEMVEVKVLMALANDENVAVGKESARNGEWVKILMKKVHTLLTMEDNDDRKTFLNYLCIDLNYAEEQRNNIMLKYRDLVQELNNAKSNYYSNKVNQYISKQIPSQKKRILGLNQLTEDLSSSGQSHLVLEKSSVDDNKVSFSGVERSWLYEVEGLLLPNHDTVNESSVCSTPLPPLEKLAGAEPISGPKTIKSILKSNSIFKAETSKGVTINEPT